MNLRRGLGYAALGAATATLVAALVRPAAASSAIVKVASTNEWDVYSTAAWYSANSSQLEPLLPYLDSMIEQVKTDFGYGVTNGKFILVLDPTATGASTGTVFGPLGVTVTANAVTDSYLGIQNFWYYILCLHETVNVWTGAIATDWVWADGSPMWSGTSPFPNACDIVITGELGLTDVSTAQAARMFTDPGVQLFLSLQKTYGWSLYQKLFGIVSANVPDWSIFPEPLRTAILTWFFSYLTNVSLLNNFNAVTQQLSGLTVPDSAYSEAQALFPL